MQADRFTVKSQEAVAAAQRLAGERRNPEVAPPHLLLALLEQEDGLAPAVLRKLCADVAAIAERAREAVDELPTRQRRRRARTSALAQSFVRVLQRAEKEMAGARRRVHLGRAHPARPRRQVVRASPTCCPTASRCARRSPRSAARTGSPRRTPRRRCEALEKFGRDLTAEAETRQARPGDRPRRGDPARDPGALAADEEQPGADRRPRRRQDRDRRGPRPADRRRATSPSRCATAA